jgi:hypothetical protein
MQIKETIGVSFPGSVERPPLEDVVVCGRRRRRLECSVRSAQG